MHLHNKTLFAAMIILFAATLAEAQNSPAAPPTTHVLVTLTLKPEARQQPEIMKLMQDEVRETLKLYLDGKIAQWYWRGDGRGVMLILNATSISEAEALIAELPFRRADAVTPEFIPLSPMIPLRALLADATGSP
jgi:hypothetical protein